MPNDIHIGSVIRQVLDDSGMPYKEFAQAIGCERQSLYYLFHSKSIDVDRLIRISKVLNYDFIRNVYLNDSYETNFRNRKVLTVNLTKSDIDKADDIVVRIVR